jgi:hypothetical protein
MECVAGGAWRRRTAAGGCRAPARELLGAGRRRPTGLGASLGPGEPVRAVSWSGKRLKRWRAAELGHGGHGASAPLLCAHTERARESESESKKEKKTKLILWHGVALVWSTGKHPSIERGGGATVLR